MRKRMRVPGAALLIAIFAVFLLAPIVLLGRNISVTTAETLFAQDSFRKAALNSLAAALFAAMISVCLGYLVAILIREFSLSMQRIILVMLTVAVLIPSISQGMGLLYLFSSNGVMSNLIGLDIGIYGFKGLITGLVLFTLPTAIIMLYDALKYESEWIHLEARALGLGGWTRFLWITVPYSKEIITRCFFTVFIIAFTDFGVALIVGGKTSTLPVFLLNEVIGQLNFDRGAVIAICLLVPSVISSFFCIRKAQPVSYLNEDRMRSGSFYLNKPAEIFWSVTLVIVAIAMLSPTLVFVLSSFLPRFPLDLSFSLRGFQGVLQLRLIQSLENSLLLSLSTAVVGTVFTYLTAYVTAFSTDLPASLLKLLARLPLAVPGMVLGLGYIFAFSGTWIYSGYAIMIAANIIHFFTFPYLLASNAFLQISEDMEIVGRSLRIDSITLLRNVYIPMTKNTIIEMVLFYFVNSMVTISALVMLSTVRTMPLAILITQFEAQMLLDYAAAITLILLIINVLAKVAGYLLLSFYSKRSESERLMTIMDQTPRAQMMARLSQ